MDKQSKSTKHQLTIKPLPIRKVSFKPFLSPINKLSHLLHKILAFITPLKPLLLMTVSLLLQAPH